MISNRDQLSALQSVVNILRRAQLPSKERCEVLADQMAMVHKRIANKQAKLEAEREYRQKHWEIMSVFREDMKGPLK